MLRIHTCFALAFAFFATVALAEQDEEQPRSPQREIDSRAVELLRSVAQHIEESDAFTVRMVQTVQIRPTDPEQADLPAEGFIHSTTYELAFEQPNLMRLEPVERPVNEQIISDGDSLYVHLPALNRYIERDAPDGLRGLLMETETGIGAGLGGPIAFVAPFLTADALDGEAGVIRSASYVGIDEVDGMTAHRIRLVIGADALNVVNDAASEVPRNGVAPEPRSIPDLHYDVWIEERDDQAILRRVQIDLTRMMELAMSEEMDGMPEGISYDMWVELEEWEFDEEIDEERFAFSPPEGTDRVDSLFEALVAAAAERPTHPLIGEPAPRFELQRLVGTQLELAEHIGNEIIILDFWATWCTPCVRAMPIIMGVAREFRDQSVVLYAVNLREDFDTVQDFINEQGWHELMVPVDIDGRVAELYNVQAIPQTVIIDREGIVQAVHVGFAPGLEEQLRRELQTLVEGRSLIAEEVEEEANEVDNDVEPSSRLHHGAQQDSPDVHDEPAAERQIDHEALRLIQRVGEQIERSENFTARIVYTFELSGPSPNPDSGENNNDGIGGRQRAVYDVSFKEPNLLHVEVVEGEYKETIVSDGESLYVHVDATNRYAETDAPTDPERLFEFPGAYGAPGGLGGPLTFVGMFLNPQHFDEAIEQDMLTRVERIGTETIEGDETQHITLTMSVPASVHEDEPVPEGAPGPPPPAPTEVPFEIWIEEREDDAVLRRMKWDVARMIRETDDAAAQMLQGWTFNVITEIHDWEFDAEIPDERFEFTPPEEAEEVAAIRQTLEGAESPDSFYEMMFRMMAPRLDTEAQRPERPAQGDDRPDPRALVGEQAPTFELQLLDGSQMELIRHRGHDIVILDFWASWCGPCVRALPHLTAVAQEFHDQNVVLYAVNVRENHETVRRFLDEKGWDLNVPMDTDRTVATKYRVRGIPQTVLIDKAGTIQAVHIGFSPQLEEQLKREVQALLDGESLVEREAGAVEGETQE